MMNTRFAVGCALLCLAVVGATNRHLRGAESTIAKRELQQFLGGGPIDPEDCPLTDPEKVCDSTIIKTVNCRGCKYDNNCLASGAGFLIRRECKLNALIVEDPEGFSSVQNCPSVPPTELCLDLIAPVTCGGCEYGNACFAEQAGFDLASECKLVATQPPVEEGFVNPVFLKNCPAPNPAFLCFGGGLGVVCGPEDCEYDSICAANAAGLNTTSCGPPLFDQSQCEQPSFTANFCVVGEPVQCGQCLYGSACVASAAGYSFLDCGPVPEPEPEPEPELEPVPEVNTAIVESVPEPIQCNVGACRNPLPAIVISCGTFVNPVTCNGCCEYKNPCLAAGAGLNPQLDCQQRSAAPDVDTIVDTTALNSDTEQLPDLDPAECPSVRDDIPCTGSSKPVLCRGCEYFNRCFAAGAGFSGDTCLLKGAPIIANVDDQPANDLAPTPTPKTAEPAAAAAPPTSPPTEQLTAPAVVVVANADDQPADETAPSPIPTTAEPAAAAAPPTSSPTEQPTNAPTSAPLPTSSPTDQPTDAPTSAPTNQPTGAPAPTCPPVSSSISCSSAFNPVDCPGDCRYENICKAEAAGFTKTQCPSRFALAPAPAPVTTSTFLGNSLGGYGGGGGSSTDSTASFLSQFNKVPAPAPGGSFGGFSFP
jgi:hypothetical protein